MLKSLSVTPIATLLSDMARKVARSLRSPDSSDFLTLARESQHNLSVQVAVQHEYRAPQHRPGLRVQRGHALRGGVRPRHRDGLRQPPLLGHQRPRHTVKALPFFC